MMTGYTLIEHTADIGIQVTAPDLKTLFASAARGTMAVIAGDDPAFADDIPVRETVELAAESAEQLLLDWLGELVSLADARQAVFTEFDVRLFSPTAIRAEVSGRRRSGILRDVKAVTAHGLKILETKGGFEVTVIFDV